MSGSAVFITMEDNPVAVEVRRCGRLLGIAVKNKFIAYNLDKRDAEFMFNGACLALEGVGLKIKTNDTQLLLSEGGPSA